MIEGNFIVIEGVDGAGTTTQVERLAAWLRERGLPVHATREPSGGPVGTMIRQVLGGRLVVPGLHGGHPPGWATMALLFAADRMDHLDAEILPNLIDGVTVICDRYDHSSVAYQTTVAEAGADTVKWVRSLNAQARRPDLTIVLDVEAEVAAKRRRDRSGRQELYEDDALQERLVSFYATIGEHFPGDRIVHLDGNVDAETVAGAIRATVKDLRGE